MESPFANAIRQSLATLRGVAGDVVRYQRTAPGGGVSQVDWQAVRGSSLYQAVNASGVTLDFETVDFIGSADDLALDGEAILPRRGDQIIASVDGQDMTYEVIPGPTQQPYIWSDESRSTLRIHTQLENTSGGGGA